MIDHGQAEGAIAIGASCASGARAPRPAAVIINADDWGRDLVTTNRSLDCVLKGAISSVSAMVFMADSERAAGLARLHGVDAGLHLNFTLPYSGSDCSHRLIEHQEKVSRYLRSFKFAAVLYHPGLAASFDYVVKKQFEEYERLYGAAPNRADGHHHMHLCANVAQHGLIPKGMMVRRNLSFAPGEKGLMNRLYRRWQDGRLARRYRLTEFFFDLLPLDLQRLKKILELAHRFDVEIETHPVRDQECTFLINGELARLADGVEIARGYHLRFSRTGSAISDTPLTEQAWR